MIDLKVLSDEAYTFFYQRRTKKLRSKNSKGKKYKKCSSYHILGAKAFCLSKRSTKAFNSVFCQIKYEAIQ